MHLSEYLILPPLRWSTVTLASCGTRQSWSTLPTTTRTAPSTPWATTPQTVATASPCSTAAPTGTFSPKGNTLTLDSVSHSLWWRCHFFHCWSQWWPLCFWVQKCGGASEKVVFKARSGRFGVFGKFGVFGSWKKMGQLAVSEVTRWPGCLTEA